MSGHPQLRDSLSRLQGKFFNLTDGKTDFRFKLEWFCTSQEQPRTEPDLLILAFVEITNRSVLPYDFSKLLIRFDSKIFRSFPFTMEPDKLAGGKRIRIRLGKGTALFTLPMGFRPPIETLEKVKQTYLRQNESSSGLCLLEVDRTIPFETTKPEFGVALAGYPSELWPSD